MNTIPTISFFALGTPKAQPRARARARKIYVKGRSVWVGDVFNPPDADQWKRDVGAAARPHMPADPIVGPVHLELMFYFPRPLFHYGTGKNAGKLKQSAPMFHRVTPDVENAVKAVMDALTEMRFWLDDCQVVKLWADKLYETGPIKPGCQITIIPLEDKVPEIGRRRDIDLFSTPEVLLQNQGAPANL